jgi:hypothetical protein
MMVIKYTNLYDPEAYGSVSIVTTRFFNQVMLRPSPLISEPENQQGSSINDGDQVYQVE